MGVAAYNRGTRRVCWEIDTRRPDADLQILRELTELSAGGRGVVLFCPTVVRLDRHRGEWVVMNREAGGWASYGEAFDNLRQVAAAFRVAFTGFGQDAVSFFYRISPLPR